MKIVIKKKPPQRKSQHIFQPLSRDLQAIEIHIDLPRWDCGLLPHNDLQRDFEHLESDIDEYPDDQ